MLIKKLIETRKADAELATEIRAALVESLFAPVVSLIVGAIGCSIIGAAVALRVDSPWIMANSVAILAVGMLRVVSALLYKKYKLRNSLAATKLWERVYEYGAWAFSALLGLLCWLTITQTMDSSLQMAVTATSTGYAAAISGRNAGRPFIAVGQLTFCTLPMAIALLAYPDWVHKALGFVILLFIYGMMDITLSIRDIIIQALTMTRKEAALAARFQEQANRFDIALNNMSHGLCMLDPQDRLQVWNERFLELLHLQKAPVRVGMRISQLVRHSIRAGNHKAKSAKEVIGELVSGLQQDRFDQFHTSPDGDRTIAVSRRMMAGGGSVVILEDVTERKRAQERITHLAKFDELTGLANRTQFRERINGMLAAVHAKSPHDPPDRPRPLQIDQRHARSPDRRQAAQGSRVPAQHRHQAGRHDHALRRRRVRRAADRHGAPSGRRVACAAPGSHAQGTVRDRRPSHGHRRLDRHRHGAE